MPAAKHDTPEANSPIQVSAMRLQDQFASYPHLQKILAPYIAMVGEPIEAILLDQSQICGMRLPNRGPWRGRRQSAIHRVEGCVDGGVTDQRCFEIRALSLLAIGMVFKCDVWVCEIGTETEGKIMRIALASWTRTMQFKASLIGLLFGLMSLVGEAVAKDQSKLVLGESIARSKCSFCHAIGKSDPSPSRTNANTSFRDLHLRFPIAMLSDAVKTGNIAGHDEMPSFKLSPAEVSALLLYIDSFSPKDALRYIPDKD